MMSNQSIWAGARILRRLACSGVALAFLSIPAQAQTSASAQDFVQADIQTGVSILQDKSLSADARRQQLHDFLLSLLDTRRIAIYTLGSAQSASPTDLDAMFDAFRDFMGATYNSRLGSYGGQTLKITDTVEHAPGDFVVRTILIDPSDPPGANPTEVGLRVVDESGKFYIVDAHIEGIWLAEALRDDFQGFLKEHNGDIAALTAHLRELAVTLKGT
jgi:ABC-type transporter MlaC component